MNRIKSFKCIAAAGFLFAGLLASPAAFAWGGYGGGGYCGSRCGGGHYGGGYHGGGYYGGHHGPPYGHAYGHYKGHYYHGGYHRPHYGGYYGGRPCPYGYGGGGYYGGGYYHDYSDLGIHDVKFHDEGGRLVAEAAITGFDTTQPVEVDIVATSDVRSTCGEARRVNEPMDVESRATPARALSQDEALSVRLETEDSGLLAAQIMSCAEQLDVDRVDFLDARIDVSQGENVMTLLCTFATPTVDGEVPASNVECVPL